MSPTRRAGAGSCVFCAIIAGESTAHVVHAGDAVIAFLDSHPLFLGHTLLVPRTHVQTLADLPAGQVENFFMTAQRLERAVEAATDADGSLVLINNVVSQSVPHLHLHVIPRRRRDGLRFWLGPRVRYESEDAAREVAARIAAEYAEGPPGGGAVASA